MTNKEQLRNQFEKDKGVRCITPKGDGDIRYIEFLESEIEKMDKDYRHRIIQLLDKAIERDERIKELESANNEHAIEFAEYLLNDFEMVSEDDSFAGRMLWELAGTHQRYTSEQIHKEWLENQRG